MREKSGHGSIQPTVSQQPRRTGLARCVRGRLTLRKRTWPAAGLRFSWSRPHPERVAIGVQPSLQPFQQHAIRCPAAILDVASRIDALGALHMYVAARPRGSMAALAAKFPTVTTTNDPRHVGFVDCVSPTFPQIERSPSFVGLQRRPSRRSCALIQPMRLRSWARTDCDQLCRCHWTQSRGLCPSPGAATSGPSGVRALPIHLRLDSD